MRRSNKRFELFLAVDALLFAIVAAALLLSDLASYEDALREHDVGAWGLADISTLTWVLTAVAVLSGFILAAFLLLSSRRWAAAAVIAAVVTFPIASVTAGTSFAQTLRFDEGYLAAVTEPTGLWLATAVTFLTTAVLAIIAAVKTVKRSSRSTPPDQNSHR